jgi:arylsulfatase A-like enzyme
MRPFTARNLVAAFAFALMLGTGIWADERRPNIVFFLVDDLGWRDLGCYGSSLYETPNIDRFAEQSVRFTQAYAACHVCSPTRASIMTGKYPARLHLTDWLPGRKDYSSQKLKNAEIHQHLPLEEITIAEALKQRGYRTAHIGKWHLGEEPYGPLRQGFDIQIPRWNKGWPKAGYHAPFRFEGLEGQPGEYLTNRLTEEAEKFIETNKDRPFFLYLSHFAVHDPIQGRKDLVAKYETKVTQRTPPQGPAFILESNPDGKPPLSSEQLAACMKKPAWSGYKVLPDRTVKIKQHQDNVQFAAMVESVDESLGRVLARLKASNCDDNTIVVFFSDNGGMSGANFGNPNRVVSGSDLDKAYSTSNLPLRGAKGWLYEGGIREPLIIHWPHQSQPGRVCDVPVISTDFYPTILEMVGLPLRPKQHTDGVSITPLLRGAENLDREAIFWHFPHYSNHGMQSPGGAVRAGDYKLLEYFENNTVQLFNLKDDVGEQKDLSRSEPDKVAQLRTMLHAWRKEVAARMMEPNPKYDQSGNFSQHGRTVVADHWRHLLGSAPVSTPGILHCPHALFHFFQSLEKPVGFATGEIADLADGKY